MPVAPLALLLCLTTACPGDGGPGDDEGPRTAFSGEAALDYVRQHMTVGPRVPGTEAHRLGGDWIAARMRERADTVIEQRWTHVTAEGDTLPLRNVLARFRPEATERVLFLTHWDSRPVSDGQGVPPAQRETPVPGANDGGSGVGLFVALADALKKAPPGVGVDLLFVDGEDWGDFPDGSEWEQLQRADVLLGSKYFAEHPPEPGYRPLYGVLFDMIGDRDLQIFHEINSLAAAPDVVARVWNAASALGYSRWFVPQSRYAVTDDHIPLIRKGWPVIDVIDLDYPDHHKPSDTIDKISARSLQIVGDVALTLVK